MKTKITLRTKITLTIVGLLAVTGIFYAANPSPFAAVNTPQSPLPHPPNQPAANATPFATVLDPSGNGPVGVAASKTDLLVTEWCSGNLGSANVDTIDCFGNVSVLATIPGPPSTCLEKYMAIAPMQAVNAGFTQRDVFVTQGGQIWQIRPPNPVPINNAPFAVIPGCAADHTGITFDHVGTFGNKMIVTCQNGSYWEVDGAGTVTMIANDPTTHPEGPVVAPSSFGVYGGQIWVADENNSQVHAISNTGIVTFGVVGWFAAEGMQVIPPAPCMYCSGGAFFQAIVNFPSGNVYQYPPTDFSGLGGNLLVTSESGAGTAVITPVGGDYVTSFFDNITGGLYEGDSFVDCDVPTPTPTATATATFTPTATSTATATFTPTATSTATATFTPTATATATFTPTPTPTPTPTSTPCQPLASCTPPYPFVSGNPRTNIAFNESEVLRAFRMVVDAACQGQPGTLQMFYNDEHAMTLGVRRTNVITCLGTDTTNYPFSAGPTATPTSVFNPQVGATEAQGGTDTSDRPMFPALYITDLSVPPGSTNELAGDWQYGGTAIKPDAVFGTWKAAVKTIDKTLNTVTVTPDADPPANNWNLGPGSDPVPTPTPTNQGYGAECRWNLSSLNLIPGHRYRLYFMVHDGDQNKTGGDVGQACVYFTMPGPAPTATPTPTATATATPTATPGQIVVGGKVLTAKTVTVKFRNDTSSSQVLTGLSITWPQSTNGNLSKITFNGTTIYNTSTGGGSLTTSSLLGTTAQRTIATNTCGTMVFTFASNVDTNATHYTGSATFNPYGTVTDLP